MQNLHFRITGNDSFKMQIRHRRNFKIRKCRICIFKLQETTPSKCRFCIFGPQKNADFYVLKLPKNLRKFFIHCEKILPRLTFIYSLNKSVLTREAGLLLPTDPCDKPLHVRKDYRKSSTFSPCSVSFSRAERGLSWVVELFVGVFATEISQKIES